VAPRVQIILVDNCILKRFCPTWTQPLDQNKNRLAMPGGLAGGWRGREEAVKVPLGKKRLQRPAALARAGGGREGGEAVKVTLSDSRRKRKGVSNLLVGLGAGGGEIVRGAEEWKLWGDVKKEEEKVEGHAMNEKERKREREVGREEERKRERERERF
jgi:hypothetical protein